MQHLLPFFMPCLNFAFMKWTIGIKHAREQHTEHSNAPFSICYKLGLGVHLQKLTVIFGILNATFAAILILSLKSLISNARA